MITQLNFAAKCLKNSGVIANPTDTIYGLSALPEHQQAMDKLILLKQRNPDKGLILLSSSVDFILPFIANNLTKAAVKKLATPNKTPTTYLFNAHPSTPYYLRGKHPTIAIRITNNPIIQALCNRCQSALVSSSANISNKPCANSRLTLRLYFNNGLDYVLSPNNNANKPSVIKDFFSHQIYRTH